MSSISSLQEMLYYQYMINNNSTSTMLNALSGDSGEESSGSLNMLSAMQSGLYTGNLVSGLGLAGTAGDDTNLLAALNGQGFSGILETYLNSERQQAAQMTEKLSDVLEEAAQTEDTGSLSYRTVQEVYEYFLERSASAASDSGAAASVAGAASDGQKSSVPAAGAVAEEITEFDFDGIEAEIENGLEASLPYSPIN